MVSNYERLLVALALLFIVMFIDMLFFHFFSAKKLQQRQSNYLLQHGQINEIIDQGLDRLASYNSIVQEVCYS